MLELAPLIKDLTVILSLAGVVALLFQWLKQPVVLGYLIAGIIVGPYTPPHSLVDDIPHIQILSELGVIFLMFSLGLEFSFNKLKRVGFSASITGVLEVICMLGVGLLTGVKIGWSFNDSLFLGAALAISSTTIIVKALEELQLKYKHFAELIFGILVIEDLMAILLLVMLPTAVLTRQFFSFALFLAIVKLILVIGGWFLAGYLLVPTLLHRIMKYLSEETLTIIAVGLCLFLVCVASYFHYSVALGAFMMGSVLAETSLVHRIEQAIRSVRHIFAAVFFVSVGMLIDPKIIFHHFPLVLLITSITILGKIVTTGISAFLTGQNITTSLRMGFSMAQIGEFSFIIIGLGISLHVIKSDLSPIIVAVSAITTFTTPYLIRLSGYISHRLDTHLPQRIKYFLDYYTHWVSTKRRNSRKYAAYIQAAVRLLINSIIIAIIFTIIHYVLLPKLNDLLIQASLSKALSWLSALLLSSPFIWGMFTAFREKKFFILSKIITVIEIIFLSAVYFYDGYISILLIITALIFFKIYYKKLEKYYCWFENQLLKNLTNNAVRQLRYEALAPWDMHLVEIRIGAYSPLIDKTLRELKLRKRYGIRIMAIYRNGATLFAPTPEKSLSALDKLVVLGSEEQIEIFRQQAERDSLIDLEENTILANFSLKSLLLGENHPLLGEAIKDAKILRQARGVVVGIERQGSKILNPPPSTLLQQGDVLLIVGNSEKLKNL